MEIKFYETVSGRSPVEELLSDLPQNVQRDFADAMRLLREGRMLSMPLSRSLADIHKGLHELRLKDASGTYRFFYYIKVKEAIYFLHGFKKKSQQLPQKEIQLVLNRIKEL